MSTLRFTPEHEWLRLEASGELTVGITDFAQQALGDVVFVQLPDLGVFSAGHEVAVLESVKAASNITMPLTGEIVEVNQALADDPEQVNASPMGGSCVRLWSRLVSGCMWWTRRRAASPA